MNREATIYMRNVIPSSIKHNGHSLASDSNVGYIFSIVGVGDRHATIPCRLSGDTGTTMEVI